MAKIIIDTNLMCRLQMSPDIYILCRLLTDNKRDQLFNMITARVLSPDPYRLVTMLQNGYFGKIHDELPAYSQEPGTVDIVFHWHNLKPSKKLRNLLGTEPSEATYKMAVEFWNAFPAAFEARRFKAYKKYIVYDMYAKIIGEDEETHQNLLKCLRKELKERERSGTMRYMRNIKTWLRNETWLAYDDELTERGEPRHGETEIH